MFVVNFDFSDHLLPFELLAINLPIAITEIVTYPLQRLQTLMVVQPKMLTSNQNNEMRLLLRNMMSVEGFPKLLHGMRYSVDYMGTQMTTRFLTFQALTKVFMDSQKKLERWKVIMSCLVANLASTTVSQMAFNYQTIASSLPVSKTNRPEDIRILLQNYTRKNKLPIQGLKYTLPVSFLNTMIELLLLHKISSWTGPWNLSYVVTDILTAFSVFSTTALFSHYAFQRQVQICKQLPQRSIPYSRGLLASLLRYNIKGLTLFSLYMAYFQLKAQNEIQSMYEKRNPNENAMAYRQ